MNLELMALRWLWLDKNCHYVLEQRSPRLFMGCPDVIGITRSRHLIEIEIKRSASDFRADFKKHHRKSFELQVGQRAKQTYFLMPAALASKLMLEIPEWAGLMCDDGLYVKVLKTAPAADSKRLTLKECVRAARLMCNYSMSARLKLNSETSKFLDRDDTAFTQWVDFNSGTYQI